MDHQRGMKEYLERGRWKCVVSPTGAHHWIMSDHIHGVCKYCCEGRGFPRVAIHPGDIGNLKSPEKLPCGHHI